LHDRITTTDQSLTNQPPSLLNNSASIAFVHLYSHPLPFVDGQPSERTPKFNKVGDERNDLVFRRLRTSLSKRRHAGRRIRDARASEQFQRQGLWHL